MGTSTYRGVASARGERFWATPGQVGGAIARTTVPVGDAAARFRRFSRRLR